MTDAEGTAQDASAASAPAAAQTPATPRDFVTEHDPAIGQAPATVAPRRRRRWAVFLLAAVVVLGLAAGLVVWAPWIPPPVLRPSGLVAGPSTANSIAFRWSRPAAGPLPDKGRRGDPGVGCHFIDRHHGGDLPVRLLRCLLLHRLHL